MVIDIVRLIVVAVLVVALIIAMLIGFPISIGAPSLTLLIGYVIGAQASPVIER
jgi:predicted membrane metal-binding protein